MDQYDMNRGPVGSPAFGGGNAFKVAKESLHWTKILLLSLSLYYIAYRYLVMIPPGIGGMGFQGQGQHPGGYPYGDQGGLMSISRFQSQQREEEFTIQNEGQSIRFLYSFPLVRSCFRFSSLSTYVFNFYVIYSQIFQHCQEPHRKHSSNINSNNCSIHLLLSDHSSQSFPCSHRRNSNIRLSYTIYFTNAQSF